MIKSYSCFLIHYIYTTHAIVVKLDDVRDCSHMPAARLGGGGSIQNLTKTDLKIRKEGGSRSLNYVSTCQSLIFRYCHNLDAKHITTLNRGGKGGWGVGGDVATHSIFILILSLLFLHSHPSER